VHVAVSVRIARAATAEHDGDIVCLAVDAQFVLH